MRILMLAQFYAPIIGGEERMTESLAVGLAARGHEVTVATLRQPGQAAGENRDGVRIDRLPGLAQRVSQLFSEDGRRHAPPAPDPETVLALRRVLARERPEIVHGHNWLSIAYLPLARRRRAAYLLSLHDYSLICANKRLVRMGLPCSGPAPRKCLTCAIDQYGAAVGPAVATLTGASAIVQRRAVDLFLPVSSAVARACGLEAHRAAYEVIPNFLIDAPLTAPPDDPRLERLPEGDFILFVGDLATDKGVGVLIAAHAAMRVKVPLVLVGRIVDPKILPDDGTVIVLGPLAHDAVLAAWRRCTLGVVPSVTPEAFGVVALEAMAAGAPVVASRHGGLADLVVDGESGLLVTPNDVAGLSAALDRAMGDAELRSRLAAGAAARATSFSASAVLPAVEAAYDRALATRRRRLGVTAARP
jgi:glycosyltransferase involved in cell wall biosynthesis